MGQVVGIDADAVAADKTRCEFEEVPLCSGRVQDVVRVDTHAVKNDRQLVDQSDVQVALGVLDDLGGFGNFDGGGFVHAAGHDRSIDRRNDVEGFGILAGDDLQDLGKRVLVIPGIDPLR